MSDPIKVLDDSNISTRSYIRAVSDLGMICTHPNDYRLFLKKMFDGQDKEYAIPSDDLTIEYFSKYLVEELIRQNVAEGIGVDLEIAYMTAETKSNHYVNRILYGNLSFILKKNNQDGGTDDEQNLSSDQSKSQRGYGSKKRESERVYLQMQNDHVRKEIIDVYINELGFSSSIANTYYHLNKVKHGPCKILPKGIETREENE